MTRRLVAAVAGLLAAGILAVPAQAAGATTFYAYDSTFYYPSQTQLVGGTVKWVNRDRVAHRVVAYTNPADASSRSWRWNKKLAAGASLSRTFGRTGNYYFRDPARSEIVKRTYSYAPGRVFYVCEGQCGQITIRN